MKTPFFIFDLAETANVPATVKARLYTHAYSVRGLRCVERGLGKGRGESALAVLELSSGSGFSGMSYSSLSGEH